MQFFNSNHFSSFPLPGSPADHWQIHHVPLNATTTFQVEFEARRGDWRNSTGGFSIDDINLSETECPHQTWLVRDFVKLLTNTDFGTQLHSPRYYTTEGYAYHVVISLSETFFGVHVGLVSGEHDDHLQWPCPWRQVTVKVKEESLGVKKKV